MAIRLSAQHDQYEYEQQQFYEQHQQHHGLSDAERWKL